MNIFELETFNLADAVKFNEKLNPRLWDEHEKMRPDVHKALMSIAEDFRTSLGIPDLDLVDITVSGSNAAYTYTPESDIDLHLVVNFPTENIDVYRELFNAKKFQYNTQHKITIGGMPVELYVQDASEPHVSQGIYSLLNNEWIEIPKRRKSEVDDVSVRSKFEDYSDRIEQTIASKNSSEIKQLIDRIGQMRKAGLHGAGEFSVENLVFKMLRHNGLLQKLFDARNEAHDAELSLAERERLKLHKPIKYGYGVDFIDEVTLTPDGTNPSTCEFTNEVTLTPDGTNPTTCQFTNEENKGIPEETIQDFVNFCSDKLGLSNTPELKLKRDPEWSKRAKTFGRYDGETNRLEVSVAGRHLMDVLRTIAHELTHQHQHEREDVPHDAGDTGSPFENEANARAGILMRDYGQTNPDLFGTPSDIDEGWKNWAAAGMASAALAGSPQAQGQSVQQGLGAIQNIGTAVNTFKGVDWNTLLKSEAGLALYNYIAANGGNPNAQNLSGLYQWQKQMQKDQSTQQRRQDPSPAGYTQSGNGPLPGYTQMNEASGYIPTAAEAKDPRFEMALTVDVRPGATGKAANAFLLNTDAQGHPQMLRPDGMVQRMMEEFNNFKK